MRYATNLFGNKYMLILDHVGVFQQTTHGSELLTCKPLYYIFRNTTVKVIGFIRE